MADVTGTAADDVIYGTRDQDTINGLGGNDRLFGFGSGDILNGGDGNDDLHGGTGPDTMTGGLGNDNYDVDDIRDQVIEDANGGNDLVFTSINYTLPANVERLAVYDPSSIVGLTLTGNTLNNEIIGGAGNDILIGGGGTDLLRGGSGNDTYIVDSADDVVGEAANGGNDAILFAGTTQAGLHDGFDYSLLTTQLGNPYPAYTQPTTIEHLGVYVQSSTNSVNLRGSIVDDLLTGNQGINVFEGQAGNDTMIGYGGDDIYFVGEAGDTVVEQDGGGYDTVFLGRYYTRIGNTPAPTVTTYTLPDNVERLTVATVVSTDSNGQSRDAPAYTLIGNALNNEISGNSNQNVLDGGLGNDILIGNGGSDAFRFSTALGATNVDQIADFAVGTDKIYLDDAVFQGLALGTLSDSQFQRASGNVQAQDADDRILYDASTGNLYYDPDGNGEAAPILFAVVHEGLNITASDFQII